MSKDRPVNLSLRTIKFPSTAIVSVLHRFSGVFLFLMIPCILLTLKYSLVSPEGFAKVHIVFHNAIVKVVLWLLLSSLVHHFFAGCRHLLMDLGFGESIHVAKCTAWIVMTISTILFVLLGVWIWVSL